MENSLIQNISSIAVWGSMGSCIVVGTFMLVQAAIDKERRFRFIAYALFCFIIVTLDSLHPYIEQKWKYEMARMVAWLGYCASQIWLVGYSFQNAAFIWIILTLVGVPIGFFVHPALATTITFPMGFGLAAVAHGRQYWKNQGYASCVLCTYSTIMTLTCSTYFIHVELANIIGDLNLVFFGYFHYAQLAISAVFFGWVNLPRELRGQTQVRVKKSYAIIFFASMSLFEVIQIYSVLLYYSWPPILFFIASIFLFAITLVLHFYYRHQLVIYTDNVTLFLEQRTASLREAQEELARQNRTQAQKLDEQTLELKNKAQVIERQRRLELAAQTAGQAAHDIQNLISPLLFHLSELQKGDINPISVRDIADKMHVQVGHLLDLNSQMLALSRRGCMELSIIDLCNLIYEMRDRFPGDRLVIQCNEKVWINGSWAQLSRAVSNLITNAFDAVKPDEDIIVRLGKRKVEKTRRCHLGFLSPGEYGFIEIEDTGPGISEDIIEKVFDPFFTTKRGTQYSGSGLGLTIVTAVVEDHKGVLDLHTSMEGTCFIIYLPLAHTPGEEIDIKQLCGNETVLVTDDDSSILQHYGKILEEAGYTVITASDGFEALRILPVEKVDLLLLDLKMPRKTGLETFFGALHIHPGIKAVVHSSYITGEEEIHLRKLGVDALLQKPASRLDILRTIREVLNASTPHILKFHS